MLEDADQHAADQVDEENQQAGNGVAADELAGAVHGAVEVRFHADLGAPGDGLLLGDDAGVQVRVDGHLLAGHGIQGEPRADFRDAAGALGHHHEVDDDEDREDHDADGVVAADDELAEGLDHLAGGIGAGVAVQQHDPGGGHVQRQPEQGGQQQDGGEGRQVERPHHVDDGQDHDQRDADVEREERVQHQRRHRQHDHRQHGEDDQGQACRQHRRAAQ